MLRPDRLSSLISHFEVTATHEPQVERCNLFIFEEEGVLSKLDWHLKPHGMDAFPAQCAAAIALDVGGNENPLFYALPDKLDVDLDEGAELSDIAGIIVREAQKRRCGGQFALSRLSELLVLSLLRFRIENNQAETGLFAGLAHPRLSAVMVAIHDEPGRDWKIDDFLDLAGMSRSQFMSEFQTTVGKTPIAYLKQWRMILARIALVKGERVKEVARKFGYSSGDAFCRAFVGAYGIAPTKLVYDHHQSV